MCSEGVCCVGVGVGAFEGTCTCKKNVVIQHSEALVLVRSAGIHVPVLYQVQVPGYSLSIEEKILHSTCVVPE